MHVALVGAGAIGTILGALLAKAGNDITLVDAYSDHVDAINKNGVRLIGYLDETIPVKAVLPQDMSGQYDLIIHLTKQTVLKRSLEQCLEYMHDETVVLCLQNGIPEELAASVVGADRVMGGTVSFPATFVEPGCSELTCPAELLGINFGRLDGEVTPKVTEIQKLIETAMPAHVTTNLIGKRYQKLTDNSVFSALPTALNCAIEPVLNDRFAMEVIAHLGREAGMVIKALGVTPEEAFGLNPTFENVNFDNEEQLTHVIEEFWTPIYSPYKSQIGSMLQDIRNEKLCEVDFINGKFIEKGEELGMDLPYMNKVADIIRKLQIKELPLESAWDNLALFKELKRITL